MGLLKKMFGGLIRPAVDAAGEISEIAKQWIPDVEARTKFAAAVSAHVAQTQQFAREHDQPMTSGVAGLDGVVNGVNRLIRPGVTIWIFGGLADMWTLPDPATVPAEYWDMALIVTGFWFGGRAIFKDLPAAIKFLKRG